LNDENPPEEGFTQNMNPPTKKDSPSLIE
jgi:hypothetical protein